MTHDRLLPIAIVFFAVLLFPEFLFSAEKTYFFETRTGFGYDSNAFLSPSSSYFDPNLGQLVIPKKQSGFFIPYELEALQENSYGDKNWRNRLKFSGQRYLDPDLNNADNYRASFDTGLEFLLKKTGAHKNTFFIGPLAEYNKEVYVDRDSGLEKTSVTTSENLGDRYNYYRYGLEANLNIRTTPVQLGFTATARKDEYEETPPLSSLDQTYFRLAADAGYEILPRTNINFKFSYAVRDYDSRNARDENGSLFASSPDLEYVYQGAGISLRNKISKTWVVYLDYNHLRRSDEYVGYNDYTRNRYQVRSIFQDEKGRRLRVSMAYWKRRYPNAFAFDDPAFQKKSYETRDIKVEGEVPVTGVVGLFIGYDFKNQRTTDPRYDYIRSQVWGGVKVEL